MDENGQKDGTYTVFYAHEDAPNGMPAELLPKPFVNPERPHMPLNISLREAKLPQPMFKNHMSLGLVPDHHLTWSGPIFERFAGTIDFFRGKVIPHSRGSWYFEPELANSWLRVEACLITIIRLIYNPLVPISTPVPNYPSDSKFWEPRDSPEKVLRSILFARKLFLLLVAEFRYAQCMFDADFYDPALRTGKFPASWLQDLRQSFAMTTESQPGYIVVWSELDKLSKLEKLRKSHVPLYVPLCLFREEEGGISFNFSHYRVPKEFEKNIPFNSLQLQQYIIDRVRGQEKHHSHYDGSDIYQELEYAHDEGAIMPDWFYKLDIEEVDPPSDLFATTQLPNTLPNSGQKPGEWWYEHAETVLVSRRMEIDLEDEEDTVYRVRLETQAEQQRLNDKYDLECPVLMYAWEPTVHHPHFLIRRLLTQTESVLHWPHYPASHRVFDVVERVWDLYDPSCDFEQKTRDLGVATIHELISSPEDAQDFSIVDLGNVWRQQDPEVPDLMQDVQQTTDGIFRDIVARATPVFCSEDHRVYIRQWFGVDLHRQVHTSPTTSLNKKWPMHLGFRSSKEAPLQEDERVNAAIECFLLDQESHLEKMLDIEYDEMGFLDRHTIKIKLFAGATFIEGDIKEGGLYVIEFDEDEDWIFGVMHASSIVFAMRQGWLREKRKRALVENFLEHGLPFHTLGRFVDSGERPSIAKDALCPQPIRPTGEFSLTDLNEYETRREELFDGPVGRVVGKSGGIGARLWRKDRSKFSRRVQQVMTGPTLNAKWTGLRVNTLEGPQFYDDKVSPLQQALICGQYRPNKSASTNRIGQYLFMSKRSILNSSFRGLFQAFMVATDGSISEAAC